MLTQLKGLVALVTGGGSGLGLAVCQRLARNGLKVVSLDLKPDTNKDENITPIKGDIRNEDDINKALKYCLNEKGENQLNALVNCGGVANAFKLYNFEAKQAQRLEDFYDLVNVNICGTFNTIRLAVELMAKNEINESGSRGVIINTSSILAYEGHEGQAGYSATQMAINSMTLPIARDLAHQSIRCNTIAAGFFDTPLVSRCDSPELLEFIKCCTPCPSRLGTPEEFAALVQSIIENNMINGEVIRIDGAVRWPERG